MKHRLYAPVLNGSPPDLQGREVTLEPDQAHHVGRVLRLRTGAELALFDGAGSEWRAKLTNARAPQATAVVVDLARREEAPTLLRLTQSWLKGAALDAVVQKATELGATQIELLASERSNVRQPPERLARRLSHLGRVIVSAAQQCGTLWLPALSTAESLSEALLEPAPDNGEVLRIMLDPGAPPLDAGDGPRPLHLLVGPEGGWTSGERHLAVDAGLRLGGLGELVLRAETAPLAALAAVRHGWGWRR